ncbi:MAG: hypothetical protein KA792_05980, partial [Bacteroidales bacterium]|nr:hypothetical protein [Bacteroidales bacterium]
MKHYLTLLFNCCLPLIIFSQNYILTDSLKKREILFAKEHCYLLINTNTGKINFSQPVYTLNSKCEQAIQRAPQWLEDDLRRQFYLLSKSKLDGDFAQLILEATDNIVDEVAFQVANIASNMLLDTRFRANLKLLIKNAELIYKIADSLKYVKLVEYGSMSERNYYTTTKYRIKNTNGDTIWTEIPRDIYYWYIVHPKIFNEGVYIKDMTSHIQERTYDYFWREFLWNNPSETNNYTKVNMSSGSLKIDNIDRLGALLKKPKVLWDRKETYYLFLRDYKTNDNALDLIGNWASRAVPSESKDPRPIQPNQIACWHYGNCAEDAYLTGAAARTALIPYITRNTACEDHQFGAIYDNFNGKEWHHFEFFLAGFKQGSQFYGMTNMTDDGNYNFTTSLVEAFRPDGYYINHSGYYNKTCNLTVKITDKNGTPVDGVCVIIYASPGTYGGSPFASGYFWTDNSGTISIVAGAEKVYDFTLTHPVFGALPGGSNIYGLTAGDYAVAGKSYSRTIAYSDKTMPMLTYSELSTPSAYKALVELEINLNEIITGTRSTDFKKSNFHFWKDEGSIDLFLCNKENYNKFNSGQTFQAYNYKKNIQSSQITVKIPEAGEWYIVMSNKTKTNNLQNIVANCQLYNDTITGITTINKTTLNLPEQITVYDIYGNFISPVNTSLN